MHVSLRTTLRSSISWKSLALLGYALCASPAHAGPPGEWLVRSPGGEGDPESPFVSTEEYRPRQLGANDAAGNSYVAAMSFDGWSDSLLVQKRTAAGEHVWSRRFSASFAEQSNGHADEPSAIDVNAAGDIVVGYRSFETFGTMGRTWIVALSGTDGTERWRREITSGAQRVRFGSLRVDSVGNAVLAGWQQDGTIVTTKLRAFDGEPAWSGLPQGMATFAGGGNAFPFPLHAAFDPDDHVVVAALASNGSAILKYDRDTGVPVWSGLADGAARVNFFAPSDLAVGADGSIAISGAGELFTATKLSGSSGLPIWSSLSDGVYSLSGDYSFDGGSRAISIDPSGHVLVAGHGRLTLPPDPRTLLVVKLDSATGAPVWSGWPQGVAAPSGPGAAELLAPRDVAVSASGDLVVTGTAPSTDQLFAIKLSGTDGTVMWPGLASGVFLHAGPGAPAPFGLGNAGDHIAVQSDGSWRLFGTQRGADSADLVCIRLDDDGGAEWTRTEAPDGLMAETFALDDPTAVSRRVAHRLLALSADGSAVLAGSTSLPGMSGFAFTGKDLTLYRFDADGSIAWRSRLSDPGGTVIQARSVQFDAQGAVLALATLDAPSTDADVLLAKFDGNTGSELWRAIFDGSGTGDDRAEALAVGLDGDVFVTLTSAGTGTGSDSVTARFDGDTGDLVWEAREHGGGADPDTAIDLALDGMGDVVVLARLSRPDGSFDSAVLRYASDTGALRASSMLSSVADIHWPRGFALAADGDAVIAVEDRSNTFPRPSIYRFARADGATRWSRALESPNTYCWDRMLEIDTSGDVVLVCEALMLPDAFSTRAWKLRGDDGSLAWPHLPLGFSDVLSPSSFLGVTNNIALSDAGVISVAGSSIANVDPPTPSAPAFGRLVQFDSGDGSLLRDSVSNDADTLRREFYSIAMAPDGSLRVAGSDFSYSGPRMLLARYETVSPRADLLALSASAGALTPAFDPALRAYALSVPHASASTTITASASDPAATLRVAGNAVGNGVASDPIALATGPNRIPVEVQVVDGPDTFAATYVVTVTRLRLSQSIDFPAPGDQTYAPGGTFGVSASGGGSGNPVRFSSLTPAVCTVLDSTVTMQSPGECDIAADQDGDEDHDAAPQVVRTITILPGTDAIFGDGFEAAQAGRP